jgi:polyhydroxyalkanoate synthesis regulator phasin
LLGHLTNYSLNKLSDKYVHAENLSAEASKQTLTQVLSSMSEEKAIDPQTIYDLLSDVTAKTLKALQPYALLR